MYSLLKTQLSTAKVQLHHMKVNSQFTVIVHFTTGYLKQFLYFKEFYLSQYQQIIFQKRQYKNNGMFLAFKKKEI